MRYYEKYLFIKVEGNKTFKNNFGEFFLYTVRTYIDKVFGQLSYDTSSKTKISIFFKCIVISVFDVFDRNLFNKDLV